MFIGHHAAAFAGKTAAPRVPLGMLMFAAMFLDLLWPVLTLAGVEHFRIDPGNTKFTPIDFHDYPISHSLATTLVWSLLVALAYFVWRRDRRGAVVVGLAVLSHWVLDFITHRPDLPLWPGGPEVGLGLWNNVPATVAVEAVLFGTLVQAYVQATKPRDRIGSIGLWSFVIFLAIVFATNLVSPPPPSTEAVSWTAMAAWLFVPWAWWFDSHRQARA
jgi:membrane-bound metal-dependent hydrolase YbcI (DUF457 family)